MTNDNTDDIEVEAKDDEQEDEGTDDTDKGEADTGNDGDDSDDDGGKDDKGEDKTDWKAEALKYKSILDRKNRKKDPTPAASPAPAPANQDTDVDSRVQAALDKRDLDALDVGDDIKKEIKNYAKLNKVSILAASKSSYVTFLKGEAEKKSRSEEAANGTKRKTQPINNFSDAKPEDFDQTTEQGRKDWAAYKQYLNKNS